MNKIFIWLLTLIIFASCTKKIDNGINVLTVNLGDTTDYVNLSDVVSFSECIPLETNDSVIIDNIIKVISENGTIYVADRFSIYKFDDNGKFQSKFDKHGIAPDEYIHISDFFMGENEEIWILSRSGQCLYNYGWDGNLKKVIKLNCWATKMCVVDKESVLLYVGNEKDKDNNCQLLLLNLNTQEIRAKYLPINDKKSKYLHIMGHNYFLPSKDGKEICFYQMFNDTIYQMGENGLSPKYYLNLDNKNIPISFFDNEYQNVMDFFQHLSPKGWAYGINWMWEREGVFWLSYYYQGECYLNILSNNQISKNVYELRDDLSLFGYPIKFEDLGVFPQSSDELIFALSPVGIIEYGMKHLDMEQQSLLKQKIRYLGDDQNMVLLKLKL